ncbi:hypothetical protein [Rhabdothermincola salaria]|uniref:hypothetical protein n=1 Tax=Rhabdothermincola salaria TaxID=2903142 RepID=UPI001E3C4481|nr:hypothetical protein [Rhabdothermincola salaria]MCD9623362.1 hypothetical protein [Rhabdothermincola salaria]
MGDPENDLRRQLNEALDLLERRDAELEHQRRALEATAGRLAECVERRRLAEARVVEVEAEAERQRRLAEEPLGLLELGVRARQIVEVRTLTWLRAQAARLPEPIADGLRRVVGLLRRSAG